MTFLPLVWRGLKAHLALSVAIGIGYWVQILRLDINGELGTAIIQVLFSTSVIVFSAPLFVFIIGMHQGKTSTRVSDAGLAGALTGLIGFMSLLCIPLLLAFAAASIAADPPVDDDESDNTEQNSSDDVTVDELTEVIGEMAWLGLPSCFAGWFSSSIAARDRRKGRHGQIGAGQSHTAASQAHEAAAVDAAVHMQQPVVVNPTPWVYAVGLVDVNGYEWIEHNGQTWYRIANSGAEWTVFHQ